MAYSLCFICTNKILGFFEFSRKQTTAGILCELLQIKLRDSTFTFPPKLQQAPYCSKCVQKLKEAHQMINNLRALEKQIEDVRNEVENKLKESCEKRRIVGDEYNSNDEDSHSEDEDSFHPFDQFREDVVKEVHPNIVSSKNVPEMKLNLKKTPTSTKKIVIESSKSLKRKLPEPNSSTSIKTRSLHLKSSSVKLSLEETLPENLNIGAQAMSSKKITLDSVDSNVPENIFCNEVSHIVGLENDLSTSFISTMFDADTEGIQECQNSGSDVDDIDNLDDAEEVFVDASSDGGFHCPHAPVCKETFLPADKANFFNHVRVFHKGKIPKTTENLSAEEMEKMFTCKFCENFFASTKLLKDHHKKHHDDEEWLPGHEAFKKKRIVPDSSGRSKKVASFTVSTRKLNDSSSKKRVHKCTYCDSSFTRPIHLRNHLRIHTVDKPYRLTEYEEGTQSSSQQNATTSDAAHTTQTLDPTKLHRKYVEELVSNESTKIGLVEHETTRKQQSQAWILFKHITIEGTKVDFVLCEKCKTVYTYKAKEGSSGLLRHVKNCMH